MNATKRDLNAYSESDIQHAIVAYKAGKYTSIRACAGVFNVPYPTLQTRLSGRTSRSHAHEHMQILSKAEERTLVRWITHLTRAGFPAPPALAMQMADEIRHNRIDKELAEISIENAKAVMNARLWKSIVMVD